MNLRFDVQTFNEPVFRKILELGGDEVLCDWYSLLGVDKFESDEAKIAQAMQQRFELVRRYQVGNYETQSQRLLDELGRARACLTNERERREYNKTLGNQTGDVFSEAIETAHFNDVVEAISVPTAAPPSAATDDRAAQGRVATAVRPVTKGLGRATSLVSASVRCLDAHLAVLAGRDNLLLHQFLRVLAVVVPVALIAISFHIGALHKLANADAALPLKQAQERELKDAQDAWSSAWQAIDPDQMAKYAATPLATVEEKLRLAKTLVQENEFREAARLYREALDLLSTAQTEVILARKQELTEAQGAWSKAWHAIDRELLAKHAAASLAAIEEKMGLAETRAQENEFREAGMLYQEALALLNTAQADAKSAIMQQLTDARNAWSTAWENSDRDRLAKYAPASLTAIEAKAAQAELHVQDEDFSVAVVAFGHALDLLSFSEAMVVYEQALDLLNEARDRVPPLAVAPFHARKAVQHQQAWATYLSTPIELTNSIGMKLALIPPGEFMMGSPEGKRNPAMQEQPHQVTLSKEFYLGTTEVTQGQWHTVMGTTPWQGQSSVKEGTNYAATFVSWEDAEEFCAKLSAREGKTYSLPTEAQWEYACRGGTTTAYSFGDDASELRNHGWYEESEQYAHKVGMKGANSFGLYDMHGNVHEWCLDWKATYPTSSVTDPQGPSNGSHRVARGGSWGSPARHCRSANRGSNGPVARNKYGGFRVALDR